jgi:hypothetical protein
MGVNIVNLVESDRRSCRAGEDMSQGNVIKMEDDGSGGRRAMLVDNGDSLTLGKTGVVLKVKMDGHRYADSTTLSAVQLRELGDPRLYIDSGDQVIECRRGTILEYSLDALHSSLTSAGQPNCSVGDDLGIKDHMFCTAGTSSAITSPVIGRVFKTTTTKIFIELV